MKSKIYDCRPTPWFSILWGHYEPVPGSVTPVIGKQSTKTPVPHIWELAAQLGYHIQDLSGNLSMFAHSSKYVHNYEQIVQLITVFEFLGFRVK